MATREKETSRPPPDLSPEDHDQRLTARVPIVFTGNIPQRKKAILSSYEWMIEIRWSHPSGMPS